MKAGSGASWLVGITLLSLVGGLIIYSYTDWQGARYLGIADKKFWDYLELLIVPAALAFGVYWLNRTQDIRQQEADELQQNRTLETVTQQAQDAALQAYLDQMSQLMLQEGLVYAEPGSERIGENRLALARARTLTVLPTLDANRKRSVLQFLYEAGLIDKDRPIVGLTGADWRGIDLHGANLSGTDLRDAYLGEADLRGADLRGADLRGADLSRVDLREANLREANLGGADLSEADLSQAGLSRVGLSQTTLFSANLRGAYLEGANLREAYLGGADLYRASLFSANLRGAYLEGANLREANLREANLSDAREVTNEQLSAAESLAGATMPDGQTLESATNPDGPTFEDWLRAHE